MLLNSRMTLKFHKILLRVTVINFGLCLIFFTILYSKLPYSNDRGVNLALGWIGWLAMMTCVVPACVSPEVRGEWFSKRFGVGSLVLLLGNVLLTISASVIAFNIIK